MQPARRPAPGTMLLLALTLVAFAANSVLCRLALGGRLIDAASFTSLRLLAGAVTLALLLAARGALGRPAIDLRAAAALAIYALCFSFAYLDLEAGTGALLLFSAVQLTMLGAALLRGERPTALACGGMAAAFAGLVYLLAPGVTAPPPGAALLMLAAGIGWGAYTLRGSGGGDPIVATGWNFIASVPLALAVSAAFAGSLAVSAGGAGLAVLSGAVTSGLGYVAWYRVLPQLSTTVAAAVQLAVPLLAALGGVALLAEPFTLRLALASVAILGGIGVVIRARGR